MAIEFNYAQNQADKTIAEAKAMIGKGGSILVSMAMILGAIADKMSMEVIEKAEALDRNAADKKAGKGAGSENVLTAELQAQTQLLNMFTQAMNNAIKTMGEGNATLSRKGG